MMHIVCGLHVVHVVHYQKRMWLILVSRPRLNFIFLAHFANSLQLCAKVVHFLHTRFLFVQMAAEIAEEMR